MAVVALGLAAVAGVTLVADLNALRAADPRPPLILRTSQAADAVRLAPWRADYRRIYAAVLWDSGSTEAANQQLETALRYGPADARAWMQYELQLAALSPTDERVAFAAARVNELGPHEPELQRAQADLAAELWHQAGLAARQAWLPSLRYTLAKQHDDFLLASFRHADENNLCSAAAALKLEQWCGYARAARLACLAGELNPQQAHQCAEWGALPSSGGLAAGGAP